MYFCYVVDVNNVIILFEKKLFVKYRMTKRIGLLWGVRCWSRKHWYRKGVESVVEWYYLDMCCWFLQCNNCSVFCLNWKRFVTTETIFGCLSRNRTGRPFGWTFPCRPLEQIHCPGTINFLSARRKFKHWTLKQHKIIILRTSDFTVWQSDSQDSTLKVYYVFQLPLWYLCLFVVIHYCTCLRMTRILLK